MPATGLGDPFLDVTVYPTTGSVRTVQVDTGDLNGCQNAPVLPWQEFGVSGSNSQPSYGGASSWYLGDALTCAHVLGTVDDFSSIVVDNTNGPDQVPQEGTDATILPGDLDGSHPFADPALRPLVFTGGSTNSYRRPWRGGDDLNADDNVDTSGPIVMSVYQGNVLPVSIVPSTTQVGVGQPVTFSATPSTPNAAYQWSFEDGTPDSSTSPSPTVTFDSAGNWTVNLGVTDGQGDHGGDAISVTVGTPPPATTTGPTTGAFTTPTTTPTTATTPGSPTRHPRRHHPAGPGTHTTTSAGPTTTSTAPSHATTTSTTSTTATTSTHTTPATTSSTSTSASSPPTPGVSPGPGAPAATTPVATTPPPAASRAPAPTAPTSSTPAPTQTSASPSPGHHSRQPLITGRLIASVDAVPAGSSPLTQPIAEGGGAAVVAAVPHSSSSPLALIASLCGVALLLGLGALRERRGALDWRSLRPPWSRPR